MLPLVIRFFNLGSNPTRTTENQFCEALLITLKLLEHTDLEAWTARKKVQATRLHPPSNLPISGLKLIEKQIF